MDAVECGCAGKAGGGPGDPGRLVFPTVGVVTVSECGARVVVDVEMGGVAGTGAGQ